MPYGQQRNEFVVKPATLDAWEVRVEDREPPEEPGWTIFAAGRCRRRRSLLWSYLEPVPAEVGQYGLTDRVHHLALVCAQDRPVNLAQLQRALMGQFWEQPPLF